MARSFHSCSIPTEELRDLHTGCIIRSCVPELAYRMGSSSNPRRRESSLPTANTGWSKTHSADFRESPAAG